MICNKCGKSNDQGASFCTGCGNPLREVNNQQVVNNTTYQNNNYNQNNYNQYNGMNNNQNVSSKKEMFTKGQKITIVSLLCIVVIGLLFLLFSNGSSNMFSANSRTIMIYACGSNLEYDAGILTADLESIDTSKVDFNTTNILVYAGGTKSYMNNYMKNTENAIFKLTSNGFEKVQTYEKLNMGSPDTLIEFMNYVYNNYSADKYDLIFYNHGGALDGAIYDDFTSDNLSVNDLAKALSSSPFNAKNKMEAVLFRTCLNGTLEIATLFEPYSEYIVFSEQVSWGSPRAPVFEFFNDLTLKDTGKEFGIKFVKGYSNAIKIMDPRGTIEYTYSIVDLSKISKINTELSKFIGGIDLNTNYNNISRIRANMHQYGLENSKYDTVDLYTLVDSLKSYSSVSPGKLLSLIDSAIIDNTTNLNNSRGISVYFPYNGDKGYINLYLRTYKNVSTLNDYHSFINSFNTMKSKPSSYAFSLSDNKTQVASNNEVSIELTKEQLENYSSAKYLVFKKNKEHPNYYRLIYFSDDAKISDDGKLSTNVQSNLLKVSSTDSMGGFLPVYHLKNDGLDSSYVGAVMKDKTKNPTDKGYSFSANTYFKMNDKTAEVSYAKVISADDERAEGMILDLERYNNITIWCFDYKLLDSKGNISSDFESAPETTGYTGYLDELTFTRESLSKDEDMYVLFYIFDVNNNRYVSNLVKVGE